MPDWPVKRDVPRLEQAVGRDPAACCHPEALGELGATSSWLLASPGKLENQLVQSSSSAEHDPSRYRILLDQHLLRGAGRDFTTLRYEVSH